MKINYHEADDILHIELQAGPIIRDVSLNWNLNIGYTEAGVGEITILDAKRSGLLPLVLEGDADKLLARKAA